MYLILLHSIWIETQESAHLKKVISLNYFIWIISFKVYQVCHYSGKSASVVARTHLSFKQERPRILQRTYLHHLDLFFPFHSVKESMILQSHSQFLSQPPFSMCSSILTGSMRCEMRLHSPLNLSTSILSNVSGWSEVKNFWWMWLCAISSTWLMLNSGPTSSWGRSTVKAKRGSLYAAFSWSQ